MDTLSHSLAGIAFADAAVGGRDNSVPRRPFLLAGILASNAANLDNLYAAITPASLGYLLHHRGHTHTLIGSAVLAAGIAAGFALVPSVRRLPPASRARLWTVIACAAFSHLVFDLMNVNGLHPFYPFDSRWVFGDAAFTFEPWLWATLGVSAGLNARSRLGRWRLLTVMAAASTGLALLGLIAPEALAAVYAIGAASAWTLRDSSPRVRALFALTATAGVLLALVGFSRVAGARVTAALAPVMTEAQIDNILMPDPGLPLCWTFIVVGSDARAGELVHYRGSLSLAPWWRRAVECPSHRIMNPPTSTPLGGDGAVLTGVVRQPLAQLKEAARKDCFVRAWLQFGRVPVIDNGTIRDLRFDGLLRENFSVMRLADSNRGCPPFMTRWPSPRTAGRADAQPPAANRR